MKWAPFSRSRRSSQSINSSSSGFTFFDTLVLMKVKPLLDELIDWLERRDLLNGAHFIERVGAPDERRFGGREILALRGTKVSYLSLLIVKHPHRIRTERIRGCLKKSGPQPLSTETA